MKEPRDIPGQHGFALGLAKADTSTKRSHPPTIAPSSECAKRVGCVCSFSFRTILLRWTQLAPCHAGRKGQSWSRAGSRPKHGMGFICVKGRWRRLLRPGLWGQGRLPVEQDLLGGFCHLSDSCPGGALLRTSPRCELLRSSPPLLLVLLKSPGFESSISLG